MKKGLKTLIVGIFLFLIGAVIIPFGFLVPLFKTQVVNHQFLVPGEHQVTVGEEGRLYLWNHYRTTYDGRTYNQPEELPDGLQFQTTNSDGESLPFFSDTSTTTTVTTNGETTSKKSVGFFEIPAPDIVTISVTGANDQRVFSCSESLFPKSLFQILAGIGSAFLAAFVGIGISIWGIVKLNKKAKPAEHHAPPPMP